MCEEGQFQMCRGRMEDVISFVLYREDTQARDYC